MHLFYDSTLNTWKLITEKLPEKPIEIKHAGFIEGWAYEELLKRYNAAIAVLKQNALTVGNSEILDIHKTDPANLQGEIANDKIYKWPGGYETKEVLSEGWVPSYNDPDNSGGHPNAEPITIAILTLPAEGKKNTPVMQIIEFIKNRKKTYHGKCLTDEFINGRFWECQEILEFIRSIPEEKKNTMENMTKEQQRVEFDKHRKEIEKIILGCRGIQSRQVHWSEAVPMVAMYITKEFEKFSHPTTASGSVAAPKADYKVWAFLYNDNVHESASATISLHLSKEGAEKAMYEHIHNAKGEYNESAKRCEDAGWPISEFGKHEAWHVQELEILP